MYEFGRLKIWINGGGGGVQCVAMNNDIAQPRFNWKSFRAKYLTRRTLLIVFSVLTGLILLDGIYLYSRVPDWSVYANGLIPKSSFMQHYEKQRAEHRDWPTMRWRPISFSAMPKYLRRAVIVAEDSRFYDHNGIDLAAFREAMSHNLQKGKMAYGASTISQQTVKNLFLSPSRNPLRKWHELVLTLMMERRLSKSRILEIYLNIAEFGRGIYGVEAAAQYYFTKPASEITLAEAAAIAASLPSPVKSNPATRSRYFIRHRDTILARVAPRTPAAESVESVLPALELEAAPTPEEEEPQVGIPAYEQHLPVVTPLNDTNIPSEMTPTSDAQDALDSPAPVSDIPEASHAPEAFDTSTIINTPETSVAPDASDTPDTSDAGNASDLSNKPDGHLESQAPN